MSYLDEIARKRSEAAQKKQRDEELGKSLDATKSSGNDVAKEIIRQGSKNRTFTQKVQVENNDLAKKEDIDAVIAQLKEVQLASLMSGQNKPSVILADSTDLGDRIASLGEEICSAMEGMKPDTTGKELLAALSKQYKQLVTSLDAALSGQSRLLSQAIDSVNSTLKSKDFTPQITVESPEKPESEIDFAPLKEVLSKVETAVKSIKIDIPKTDYSALEDAVRRVESAINGQVFPVPNYVLPFKDINGKAVQVQLDASGNVPTSGGGGGGGGGTVTIADGVDNGILSTVFDYPTSNPQAVISVDQSGDAFQVAREDTLQNLGNSLTNIDTSLSSIDGKTPALGQTTMSGSSPVTIASNQTAIPTSVSSLPLPSGAATSAKQDTSNTSLASIDTKLATAKTADYDTGAGTDTVQMTGIALPANGGAVAGGTSSNPIRTDPTGTTTQPVSGTVTATQSGTWTVQPGNTANTTAWLVSNRPATSGGLSIKSASTGGTVTSIKASAGQLYGYHLFNTTAAVAYVQIFNVASGSVTLGTTTPDISIGIPASGGVTVNFDNGIAFGTAMSYACTTTRTGSTGATCDVNFFYS